MTHRLDQQIERIENIVNAYLDFCKETRNGKRCILPAEHEQIGPHKFSDEPGEFRQ